MIIKLKNLLFVVLIICELRYSKCFKWVPLKSGDNIPANAVSNGNGKYVGRTKYLNTLQIAGISTSDYDGQRIEDAVIKMYSTKIVRHQFEVLVATATEKCDWIRFDKMHVPENIVRGGTAWDMEPVYVGATTYSNIASIYLTTKKIQSDLEIYADALALICDNLHQWVDATSLAVPENSVRTGDGDGYVARLLGPNLHVPGIVYTKSNETSIWYKNYKLESFNIEVLVGQPQQYKWKNMKPKTGIPENAVACGVSENNEITYIAKKYNAYEGTKVFPITFSDTNQIDHLFKILVETVKLK